jgi:diaminopimelate epimerase
VTGQRETAAAAGMPFWKAYAEGNSYVVVESSADVHRLLPWVVDGRRGVGGDGLLVVDWRSDSTVGMRIFNADGSEAPACGNGARCVAALTIVTGRARADTDVIVSSPGTTIAHRLDDRARLLLTQTLAVPADPVVWQDGDVVQLDLGTAHRVVFGDISRVDPTGDGPQHAQAWPGGTNVMFAQVTTSGELDVVPWERGVGPTLGCATGAAAAAIAAGRGVSNWPYQTVVRQPGGTVRVTWQDETLAVQGTVRILAEGTVRVPCGDVMR